MRASVMMLGVSKRIGRISLSVLQIPILLDRLQGCRTPHPPRTATASVVRVQVTNPLTTDLVNQVYSPGWA